MRISSSPSPGQYRQQDKVTGADKPKNSTEQSGDSGGMSIKAVWDSQAGRRAEEKAAAAAERVKRRTAPTGPAVVTDGSNAALRTLQDTVKSAAEARRRDEAKAQERAAEARREEKARAARLNSGEQDPFRPDWKAEARVPTAPRPSEADREPKTFEPGSLVDTYA
jgi:hypothetical protein